VLVSGFYADSLKQKKSAICTKDFDKSLSQKLPHKKVLILFIVKMELLKFSLLSIFSIAGKFLLIFKFQLAFVV
jgi:hypothetical protein